MKSLGNNIWYVDGDSVPFYTLPYTTRMVIVRLAENSLWIHSPIKFTKALAAEIDNLGEVRFLVAPNKLHHLFLNDWQQHYPSAAVYGTDEVATKRSDIKFDGILDATFIAPWKKDIAHRLFTGSKAMQECVFFHYKSKTLIVTDLIENFPAESLPPLKRFLAKISGILAPNGKMPIDWRLSFNKETAREHMQTILRWQPDKIVMAHGLIIEHDAVNFLRKSFNWLKL